MGIKQLKKELKRDRNMKRKISKAYKLTLK